MLQELINSFLSTIIGQITIAVASVVLLFIFFEILEGDSVNVNVPRIGRKPGRLYGLAKARAEFTVNGRRLVEEGYRKYKYTAFKIQTGDMERVVLPVKYLSELRRLPQSLLNAQDAQCERHLAWWNYMDTFKLSQLHSDVVKHQLNQNLDKMIKPLTAEASAAWEEQVEKKVTDEKGFIYLPTQEVSGKVIARVVNRVIVGPEICRDKRWHENSFGFAVEAFTISGKLRSMFKAFRPFVYIFLSSRRKLKSHLNTAHEIIRPVVEKARRGETKDMNLVQWMVDADKDELHNSFEITRKTLVLCLASIISSSNTVTYVIYDLCARPEYISILRDEILEVVGQSREFTMEMLRRMKKLDSFAKECLRFHNLALFAYNRKVIKDIRLADGTVLPAGCFVSVPAYEIARDAEYYDNPNEFQPLRFYELSRRNPGDASRYQFASSSSTDLLWGYSSAACPGRYFAVCEIKLSLALLILNYDFRFPDGQTERPPNIFVDERIFACKRQLVGFKRRQEAHAELQSAT